MLKPHDGHICPHAIDHRCNYHKIVQSSRWSSPVFITSWLLPCSGSTCYSHLAAFTHFDFVTSINVKTFAVLYFLLGSAVALPVARPQPIGSFGSEKRDANGNFLQPRNAQPPAPVPAQSSSVWVDRDTNLHAPTNAAMKYLSYYARQSCSKLCLDVGNEHSRCHLCHKCPESARTYRAHQTTGTRYRWRPVGVAK